MWVKVIEGNEPLIVNSDAVDWIEGISGGQHCTLNFRNGRQLRVPKPADDVQALLDWASPGAPGKEKQHARR